MSRPTSSLLQQSFSSSNATAQASKTRCVNVDSPRRLAIKQIVGDFLVRSRYSWGASPRDEELRAQVLAEARRWDDYGNAAGVEQVVDTACSITESAYGHTSPAHRLYVALYTASLTYVDDFVGATTEAVRQFASRLTRGEPQLTIALETLAVLMRQTHELWPAVGADAIISGTIDAVTAMYIEYAAKEMVVSPHAERWPMYFRTRTAVNPPYNHFIFMKAFRETPESYLQMLP